MHRCTPHWLIACLTLAACLATTQAMPASQPTRDFIKWAGSTYGTPVLHPANPLPFAANMAVQAGLNQAGVQAWLNTPKLASLPADRLSSLWSAKTVEETKCLLGQLAQVLQPKLREVCGLQAATLWQIFGGSFSWLRLGGLQQRRDICMPYKHTLLSRKRRGHDAHSAIYIKDGYVTVLLGKGVQGQSVFEPAHRLVCFVFNGPPPNGQHKHVNHLCCNPSCLNPRHLQWATVLGNMQYPGGSKVGLVPELHEPVSQQVQAWRDRFYP